MNMKKCDICGKIFDRNTDIFSGASETEQIAAIEIDFGCPGTITKREQKDLCPVCLLNLIGQLKYRNKTQCVICNHMIKNGDKATCQQQECAFERKISCEKE